MADVEAKLTEELGSIPEHHAPSLIAAILTSSISGAGADYRLYPNVLAIMVQDGTARLLDLAGNTYAISATGAAMLEAALMQSSGAACEALAVRFHIGVEQVRTDMAAFLEDLTRQKLLAPCHSRPDTERPVLAACASLTAPLLHLCTRAPRRWMQTAAWVLLTAAYASVRLFGWSNTVRLWARCTSKSRDRRSISSPDHGSAAGDIDRAVTRQIALHPFNVGCKERALCCWALARAAGLPARIVLGVDLFPLALHCWCESGSSILADRYAGKCDRYTPILTYP